MIIINKFILVFKIIFKTKWRQNKKTLTILKGLLLKKIIIK